MITSRARRLATSAAAGCGAPQPIFGPRGSLMRSWIDCGAGEWLTRTARPAFNITHNRFAGSADTDVADLDDRLDIGVVRNVPLQLAGHGGKCTHEIFHPFARESADRG